METPADELEDHYRRYEEFFAEYDITIDDPLGEFAPATGVTAAPTTLENLEGAEYENAIEGFADDVYVETPEGLLKGRGTDEPDVSPTEAPGADAEDDEASAD
mgnify:FL=1